MPSSSVYPGALDALSTTVADGTAAPTIHKDLHNSANDAVNKIEAELGINPKGAAATVLERFQSIPPKGSVRAATTANGTLATAYENADVIDGVTLATGDRILLKNQTTGSENGVYKVNASGAPTRTLDAATTADFSGGMQVTVREGTTLADSTWRMTTNPPITVGTTSLTFARSDALAFPWTPIFQAHTNLAAAVAGSYISHNDISTNVLISAASPAMFTQAQQYIDPADYAIAGRVMQMRIVASFAQNAVANAGTSVATAWLAPVNPAGATTTWLPTFGATITGSDAAKTGGTASSSSRVLSSTFTAPTAGLYTMIVIVTTATTAGATRISLRLEYRMV